MVRSIVPDAVDQVLRDHEAIRAALDELGLQVELHTLRKETVDAFLALLRAHAAREDATLYRAADEALDDDARRRLAPRAA